MRDLVVLVVLSSATFGSKVLALELSHDLTLVLLGALAIGLMRFGDMHQKSLDEIPGHIHNTLKICYKKAREVIQNED